MIVRCQPGFCPRLMSDVALFIRLAIPLVKYFLDIFWESRFRRLASPRIRPQ